MDKSSVDPNTAAFKIITATLDNKPIQLIIKTIPLDKYKNYPTVVLVQDCYIRL